MTFLSPDLQQLVQYLLLVGPPLLLWQIPYVSTFFPLVIVQLVWGVLMGPSGLKQWNPSFYGWIFNASGLAALKASSNWGILLFVLFTGLHIDRKMFLGKAATKEFWAMAILSMLVPLAVGCLVGGLLAHFTGQAVMGPHGSVATFCLSLGIACGVTALPVLSAILLEMNQLRTGLGKLLIMCATFHDLGLWILLTVVLGLIVDESAWAGVYQPLATFGLVVCFLLFMIFVVGKGMKLLFKTQFWQTLTPTPRLMFHMMMMCICCSISDLIQIHTMLGAVLYGACMARHERPFLVKHAELLNRALLLPLFFGSAGQKVVFSAAGASAMVSVYLGTLFTVFICLFCGVVLPSRFMFGRSWPRAFMYFSYLISKGVVEIVVCTLLLDRKVINGDSYAGLILMALTCTGLTKPFVLICAHFESDAEKREREADVVVEGDEHGDDTVKKDKSRRQVSRQKSIILSANNERARPAVPEGVQAIGVIQETLHERDPEDTDAENAPNNRDSAVGDDGLAMKAVRHAEEDDDEVEKDKEQEEAKPGETYSA